MVAYAFINQQQLRAINFALALGPRRPAARLATGPAATGSTGGGLGFIVRPVRRHLAAGVRGVRSPAAVPKVLHLSPARARLLRVIQELDAPFVVCVRLPLPFHLTSIVRWVEPARSAVIGRRVKLLLALATGQQLRCNGCFVPFPWLLMVFCRSCLLIPAGLAC